MHHCSFAHLLDPFGHHTVAGFDVAGDDPLGPDPFARDHRAGC